MDKVQQTLLEGLKQAAEETGEQRLYKSGKLAGVFPGRNGTSGDAAAQALRDGLLEVVRRETRGKTTVEWVRITPKGIDYLHSNESPVRAMQELREVLQMTQEGVPVWLADIRQELTALGTRLTEEVQNITHRLEVLSQRVVEALKRADAAVPQLPPDAAEVVPWGGEVMAYLDRRRESGIVNHCSLPELFAALKEKQPELLVKDFHAGLRLLHDRGVLRLLPSEGNHDLPEPELALVDGAKVYYHVARQA